MAETLRLVVASRPNDKWEPAMVDYSIEDEREEGVYFNAAVRHGGRMTWITTITFGIAWMVFSGVPGGDVQALPASTQSSEAADPPPNIEDLDPQILPTRTRWDPKSGAVVMSLPASDQSADGSKLLVLRLVGPCADPRLDRLPASEQEAVRARWGANAEENFRNAFAKSLDQTIDALREAKPNARISVAGLPLESRSGSAEASNAALRGVIDKFDALVSTRSFIDGSSSGPGEEAVAAALSNSRVLADGRPIFYRLNGSWHNVSLRDAPMAEHEPSNEGDADSAVLVGVASSFSARAEESSEIVRATAFGGTDASDGGAWLAADRER